MPQSGRRAGLAQESLESSGVVKSARQWDFYRYLALELRVMGAIDRAEGAGTQTGPNEESADL
jgi:hypothetical protein